MQISDLKMELNLDHLSTTDFHAILHFLMVMCCEFKLQKLLPD